MSGLGGGGGAHVELIDSESVSSSVGGRLVGADTEQAASVAVECVHLRLPR